jgi:hypothetical protein
LKANIERKTIPPVITHVITTHLCQLVVVHAVKVDAAQELLLVLLALLLVIKPARSTQPSQVLSAGQSRVGVCNAHKPHGSHAGAIGCSSLFSRLLHSGTMYVKMRVHEARR